MNTGNIIRFLFIAVLWLFLVYVLLEQSAVIGFKTIFAIVASGIVVFVPLYKKYVEKGKEDKK